MIDISTPIAAGLVALASKELIIKVLGPSADWLGQETRWLIEKCNNNLIDIFRKAYKKLGNKTEVPGEVNIRILGEVINQGKFAHDQIVQEYLGGILASSRSKEGTDDRGIYYLSLIKGLSRFQLSLHYIAYLRLCIVYNRRMDKALDKLDHRQSVKIRIPKPLLIDIFGSQYEANTDNLVLHALTGLREKTLIGQEAVFIDGLKHPKFQDIQGKGVILSPTILGCDLFLWGNGLGHLSGTDLGNVNIEAIDKLYDVTSINIEEPNQ